MRCNPSSRAGTIRTVVLTAVVSAGVASSAALALAGSFSHDETTSRGFPMVQGERINVFKVMGTSPALLQSYKDVSKNLKEQGSLSQAEINVVLMTAAVENKCKYCTAAHTGGARRNGVEDETIRAIQESTGIADEKLRVLHDFTLRVYETRGRVSDDEIQTFLDAGYTHGQALDVVACLAAKVMTNYANQMAGTPVDEFLQAEIDKMSAAKTW